MLAAYDAVVDSEVASADPRLTPTDEDSMEHRLDFGGGAPRIVFLPAPPPAPAPAPAPSPDGARLQNHVAPRRTGMFTRSKETLG